MQKMLSIYILATLLACNLDTKPTATTTMAEQLIQQERNALNQALRNFHYHLHTTTFYRQLEQPQHKKAQQIFALEQQFDTLYAAIEQATPPLTKIQQTIADSLTTMQETIHAFYQVFQTQPSETEATRTQLENATKTFREAAIQDKQALQYLLLETQQAYYQFTTMLSNHLPAITYFPYMIRRGEDSTRIFLHQQINYNPNYGDMTIHINDSLICEGWYHSNLTLTNTTITEGDKIKCILKRTAKNGIYTQEKQAIWQNNQLEYLPITTQQATEIFFDINVVSNNLELTIIHALKPNYTGEYFFVINQQDTFFLPRQAYIDIPYPMDEKMEVVAYQKLGTTKNY